MSDLLARIRAGIASVPVPEDVRAAAEAQVERWLQDEALADYLPQIQALADAARFDELVDAFRQVLPFGTGGRRGHVGVGPNRMNAQTVGSSVQGHAQWLRQRYAHVSPLKVVLAYDVRRFEDVRGQYDAQQPSPIHGVSSRGLAELAARIYAANGVHAYLHPATSPGTSTPELSFTIRRLQAHGGLNVSASHNPPDDNGVKVYDALGAQLVAPDDQALLDVVSTVRDVRTIPWEAGVASGCIHELGSDDHAAYIAAVAGVVPADGPRDLRILYTPLHGTGTVHEALAAAGFSCTLHAAQAEPDGRFPTVPDGVANPENAAAMAHAIDHAGDADLIFGTDPDADRLGCEVRHQGAWVHLSGNDIAVLTAYRACRLPHDRQPLVVVTEVTTSLVQRVVAAEGGICVDNLLVGFKHIADGLRTLEETGTWQGLRADQVTFAAGGEESNGVLVTDAIRDKDAAGGAVMLSLLAAEAKASGQTLVDVLQQLHRTHGAVRNDQISVRFPGAQGAGQMAALLDGLRAAPPTELAGRPVTAAFDHLDENGRFGAIVSTSARSARNVLVYHLGPGPHADDGARVILRPSGTEPKLKLYLEVSGRPELDAQGQQAVDASLAALGNALQTRLQA